ncbi:MAG: hypothetical protein P8Y80_06545 [Acidobacteriota bacterium]|jgi:hypothetical protein
MEATRQAVMGQGLPPEAPWVVFNYNLFLVDSDLTLIKEKYTEIVYALTGWQPSLNKKGTFSKAPVEVSGRDHEDALARAHYLFLRKNWGDGLAIFPPTKSRVDWILTGTDHNREETVGGGIGKVAPKAGILSYEVLATCMAMAGGRPEYMPVAEAVCRTIIEKQNTLMTSSGGAYQGVCVNGSIAKQIRLNSGFSLFGPDPNHPAGGAIGRCISLVLMNVGGHVAGQGTIAEYAEMRFTGLCFAENEDNLPQGWTTFAEEKYKRPKGTNSATFLITFLGGLRPFVHRGTGNEPDFETEMNESFYRAANVMKSVGSSSHSPSPGMPGIMFYNSMICNNMAGIGWTKDKIRKHLAELVFVTPEEIKDRTDIQRAAAEAKVDLSELADRIPLITDPRNINFICAGGDHPSLAMWLAGVMIMGNVEIQLPRNWEALLIQAEQDLGPLPAS